MPESDTPPPMTESGAHTSSPQWQSFEMRMRRRRAERCLVRADESLGGGSIDEARAALDEARELAPTLPAVAEMEQRIEAAANPPVLNFQDSRAATADTPDREDERRRFHAPRGFGAACVCLAFGAAGSFWWFAGLHPTASAPLEGALRSDVTLRADPVVVTQHDTEPAARVSEPATAGFARPAAISTTGPAVSMPAAASVRDTGAAAAPAAGDLPDAPSTEGVRDTPMPVVIAEPAPANDAGSRPPREERIASATLPIVEAVPLSSIGILSTPSPPVAAPDPAPTARRTDTLGAVRATLARYEAAYSALNVSAARAIWPGVDERALSRAFDGLASQRVALDKCDVMVSGPNAHATCTGSAEWTPKVGGVQRRRNRRWAFDLTNAGGIWQIVRAEARE
jgi:hypothetical protein